MASYTGSCTGSGMLRTCLLVLCLGATRGESDRRGPGQLLQRFRSGVPAPRADRSPLTVSADYVPSRRASGAHVKEVSRPVEDKKRILMLISDTGGGHRASAQAIESMLEKMRPGATDVRVVDVYSDYCPFPYSKFVSGYSAMAKQPFVWKATWYLSAFPPMKQILSAACEAQCAGGFARMFKEHDPDLIVSLHPLTQQPSLHVLQRMAKRAGHRERQVPFATIVTDLGSAHPTWFDPNVDACFIPSDAIRKVAQRRRLKTEQIKQYGLPVRPAFWEKSKPRGKLQAELGLDRGRRTVLVMGGGDGVGSLGQIVDATATSLGKACPGEAQVIAVCGKNAKVRNELESRVWSGVDVQVHGFVNKMSDYMECADVVITKAGPGTIAEATIRGVPTMLSSFLPGQEAGNVPFVTQNGFGDYTKNPKEIAKRVTSWIQDPEALDSMSRAAKACAAPQATGEIAHDLLAMLDRE